MGAFVDLTNNRFGKLTVIKRVDDYISPKGRHYLRWLCQCDCGSSPFSVLSQHLKNGATKSCGCYSAERTHDVVFEDLTNQRFGKLTVLEADHKKNGATYWLCQCDCGNKSLVTTGDLKRGNSISCGCSRESIIATELKQYFIKNYDAVTEYKMLKNPHTNHWLKCDIYLPKEKVFIEINGFQHYEISYWNYLASKTKNSTPMEEFKKQKIKDRIKRKYAKENGIYVEIDLRKIKSTRNALEYINKILDDIII